MRDPGPIYASPAEVGTACKRLTVAEHLRLRQIARIAMHGAPFTAPGDLIAEAIGTAFLAAQGEGGRRWPRKVPFMSYLVMTMRGIASDARRAIRWRTLREIFDSDDDELKGRITDLLSVPSVEEIWTDEEEGRRREEFLRAHFRDDPEILAILDGISKGFTAPEIRKKEGMTDTEYDSARRRLRRNVERLRKTHASSKKAL
jgi:hypothetical protein